MCSKEFYQPLMLVKTFENVFLVVQTTDQNKLMRFGFYNPDNSYVFRIIKSEFLRYFSKLKEFSILLGGEGHSGLCDPEHDFFHVVHIAPTVSVVQDAQRPR